LYCLIDVVSLYPVTCLSGSIPRQDPNPKIPTNQTLQRKTKVVSMWS